MTAVGMPFDITDEALAHVREIMARKAVPEGYGLRVGIRGAAGCAGVAYLIGFDKAKEHDRTYTLEGLEVYMDKRHALYLAGLKVDWQERETERGFAFIKGE